MGVRKTYQIDPKYAGIVIGKGGSDLRALKEMPGVNYIYFDTRSSSNSHTLQVTGVNQNACEAVYREVQRRIKLFMMIIPEVSRTFIDVNDRSLDTIQLAPFGSEREESVVIGSGSSKKFYSVSAFTKGNLCDTFDLNIRDSQNIRPNFMEFLEKNISMSFDEALKNHRISSDETLRFHMSPGKHIFVSPVERSRWSLLRSKITGSNGIEYMKEQNMKTFFTPNLDAKYIRLVNKNLEELEFENLNEGCPEIYTTVHLNVGDDQIPFSVIMVLDKNLETPKDAKDDPRLSEQKRKSVQMILDAKTIGDVMGISRTDKIKMKYYRLTLDVHPDKNLHPGATEAFKKLNDAFEKLKDGKPVTAEALKVENNVNNVSLTLPPKVVRIRTRKIRICVVTTLSDKDLDLRGSLVTFEEDKENLSDHVKQALNLCWDQRDSFGRIPTPAGEQKITIRCIKQVIEAHNWAKEIPYGSNNDQSAVLEIKIKRLREKRGDEKNWNDCVEIDLKLNRDFTNKDELTGERFAREMIEIKKWVDRIMQ